jgi:dipeptidyl aminopeptidase/acylaminoacyl peptidase
VRTALVVVLLLTAASATAADLADAQTFLGQTAYDEVRLSPDGDRLAFITRRNEFEHDREETALWLIDLSLPAGSEAARPVRITEPESCSGLRWSPDGRALTFLATPTPEAGPQLFLLTLSAGAVPRRLTDPARFTGGIDLYDWLPDGSGLILAAAEPPDEATQRKLRDFYGDVRRLSASPAPRSALFRLALPDGRVERLAAAPFDIAESLSVSPDGRWLAVGGSGLRQTVDTGEVALLPLTPGAAGEAPRYTRNLVTEESLAWAGRDLFVTGPGEEKDGRYTMTEARMYRVDLGDLHLVRVAPGLPGYLMQQVPLPDGSLLTLAVVSTGMRVSRVEPASGKVVTLREHRGWIDNLSASRSGDRLSFIAGDAQHFSEIYVAQGPNDLATARPVTDFNAALSRGPLPEIETVSWDSKDGTAVEGVLFWPPGRKGDKGLPLIVDLHGGPFGAARTEAVDLHGPYMSYPALLAARGFLVLNPNYRGSAGRGDEFARGIEGHRCSRPSQDVIRGVESLIARGWADRGRVGLIGYSGGGGLSKCLLGRTDLFRAVCTGAGIWDDLSLFGTPRGGMWAEAFYESKPIWEDFARWWNESPIGGLGQVKTPTLIVAGERDSSAAPEQARELYHDLVWRGVPAEALLFPGEGHVFSTPSHKRTKIRAEVSWLEHYVLGKPRTELPEAKP